MCFPFNPDRQNLVGRMIKDDRIKVDASRSLYVQQDVSHKLDIRPQGP